MGHYSYGGLHEAGGREGGWGTTAMEAFMKLVGEKGVGHYSYGGLHEAGGREGGWGTTAMEAFMKLVGEKVGGALQLWRPS